MKVCLVCERSYDDWAAGCSEESHPPLVSISDRDSQAISGYQLEDLIKVGPGGEIHRARQVATGTSCLIKIARIDEESRSQFLSEAEIAAGLYHPNVVNVYEAGTLPSGEVFLVAEDPDGRTLRRLLDDVGAPDLLTSIEFVRQGAEALHAIHVAGLVHRAINPDNIILTTDAEGRALVRIQNIDLAGTCEKAIISNKFVIDSHLNSLRYFSPEQCSGEQVGTQSDVYSLGIVFYEMLAGAPPFDAANATAIIHKQKNQAPAEIRIENFELRMLVTHSLTESLQKHARLRQSTANLFARQLRHIEQLATHSSTPPPAGTVAASQKFALPIVVDRRARVEAAVAPALPEILVVETAPVEPTPVSVAPTQEVLVPAIEPVAAVVASAVYLPPRRSRLKVWKKKLHTLASQLAVQRPESIKKLVEPVAATIVEIAHVEREVVIEPEAPRPEPVAKVVEPVAALVEQVVHVEPEVPTGPTVVEIVPLPAAAEQIPAAPIPVTTETIQTVNIMAENVELPPVRRLPTKIEWAQPEDDIPSEAEVAAVLASEGVVEIPLVISETVEPVVAVAESAIDIPATKPLEEPLPIPTPAPVLAEVVEQTVTAVAVETSPEKEVIPDEPVRVVPAAKPVITKPAAVIHADRPKKKVATVAKGAKAAVSAKPVRVAQKPAPPPIAQQEIDNDAEEITLVRPPGKRITVRLDRPVAPQGVFLGQSLSYASADIPFFPTILGGRDSGEVVDVDPGDSMFGAHFGSTGTGMSVPYRSILIGGGIMAAIVLFLFGSNLFQDLSTGDSSTARATSSTEIPPTVSKATVPVKLVKPVAEPRRENQTQSETAPRKDASKEKEKPSTTSAVEKVKPPPPVSETVKKSPTIQKAPGAPAPKVAPGTRPRIVKEAQP